MSNRLLFHMDNEVAAWAFDTFKIRMVPFNMCLGIVGDDKLAGAAMFRDFNGHNIELDYYGPKTVTLGIVRTLAKVAVEHFGVSRVTAHTYKYNKTVTAGIKKLGFVYEGIQRNFYGQDDAVVFGLYGQNLAKLAGKELH